MVIFVMIIFVVVVCGIVVFDAVVFIVIGCITFSHFWMGGFILVLNYLNIFLCAEIVFGPERLRDSKREKKIQPKKK